MCGLLLLKGRQSFCIAAKRITLAKLRPEGMMEGANGRLKDQEGEAGRCGKCAERNGS